MGDMESLKEWLSDRGEVHSGFLAAGKGKSHLMRPTLRQRLRRWLRWSSGRFVRWVDGLKDSELCRGRPDMKVNPDWFHDNKKGRSIQ